MNKIFKIVFNAARGKMMVVNEATSSVQTGKKAAVTVAVISALAAGSAMAGTLVEDSSVTIQKEYVGVYYEHPDIEAGQLQNGQAHEGNGGALWFTKDANQTLDGVTIAHNAVYGVGGGMGVGTGAKNEIVVQNSKFEQNWVDGDGGAIANYKQMTIKNTIFDRNDAHYEVLTDTPIGGGAIALGAESTTIIEKSHFEGNNTSYHGGAIATREAKDATLVSGTYKVVNSTFFGNECDEGKGGAIYNTFYKDSTAGSGAGIEVSGSHFLGNDAIEGGAIYNAGLVDGPDANDASGGKMTITSSKFETNYALKNGGAIFNQGEMTIKGEGTTFSQNVAVDGVGGAIATSTKATDTTIDGATFTENHATYDGGAISNYSNLSIDNSTFVKNTAQFKTTFEWTEEVEGEYPDAIITVGDRPDDSTAIGGGAIALGAVSGTTIVGTITNTVFSENESGTNGGAIATRQAKDATLVDATYKINAKFVANEAYENGGAIYNSFYKDYTEGSGAGVEVSGEFLGNDARQGGAIYNAGVDANDPNDKSGGVMTITGSTFFDNEADAYGGAIFNGGKVTVKDSTFTQNYSDVGAAIATSTKAVGTVIDGVTFEKNHARYDGGAIGSYSSLSIKDSTFKGNVAGWDTRWDENDEYAGRGEVSVDNLAIGGGAIALGAVSKTDIVSIENTLFEGNMSSSNGGAIATRQSYYADAETDPTLVDGTYKIEATFTANETKVDGGAIYNAFYKDYSKEGAGVEIGGVFTDNVAGNNGGAIYNAGLSDADKNDQSAGVMTITDSTFTGNEASEKGGAIYNEGTITLAGTNTFMDNKAAEGNDIYNAGTLKIEGTTTLGSGMVSTGTVEVDGKLALGGTSDLAQLQLKENANLTVGGNATIDSLQWEGTKLGLTGQGGTLALGQNLQIDAGNSLVIDGDLNIAHTSNEDAPMALTNAGTMTSSGEFSTTMQVVNSGTAKFEKNSTFANHVENNGTMEILGDATFDDMLQNVGGTLTVAGKATVSDSFDNDATATFKGDIDFLEISNKGAEATMTVAGNAVVQDVILNGDYDHEGKNVLDFKGSLTAGSFLQSGDNSVTTVGGNATFAGDVDVDQGVLNLNGETNVVNGDFVVDGEVNSKGTLTAATMLVEEGKVVANSLIVDKTMDLFGAELSAQALTVGGETTLSGSNATIGNANAVNTFADVNVSASTLDVTGATNTVGDLTVSGASVVSFTGNNTVGSVTVVQPMARMFALRSVRSDSPVISFNGNTTIEGDTNASTLNVEGSIEHGGNVNTDSYNANDATIGLSGEQNNLGNVNANNSTFNPEDGSNTNMDSFTGENNQVNLTSADTQFSATNDTATGTTIMGTSEMTDKNGGTIDAMVEQTGGLSGTYVSAQGDVFGTTTGVVEDGKVVSQQTAKHETNEQITELSTAVPAMIARIEANDLRKRMGDLRAAEGTHGAWARYDGGKLSGENGLENTFHKVQVGIDTIPEVGAPRFGVAFSYADGDVDMTGASADTKSYSLAAYGIWMGESGQFIDVIGRMGNVKSDLKTNTYNEELDQVVLSLSGEFGWRFDVTDTFYVEPSVEATYTYVNSDNYAANGNTFKVDDYDSMVARAGFAAGFKCPNNFGDVYLRAGVAHEFMGDAKFIATNAAGMSNPVEVNGEDTWFEYAIGANFNINKNTYVYADIERTEGADLETDWRANVGVRYAF